MFYFNGKNMRKNDKLKNKQCKETKVHVRYEEVDGGMIVLRYSREKDPIDKIRLSFGN